MFLQASGLDAELADMDLADPELNKAATMIQSSYRGFHARKDMAANNKSTKNESPAGPHDTDSADGMKLENNSVIHNTGIQIIYQKVPIRMNYYQL